MTRGLGLLAAGALGLGLVLASAAPASADVVDDGESGLLWIETPVVEVDAELSPGDRILWPFTVGLSDQASSSLHLRIDRSGALALDPAGLTVEVLECSVPWTVPADPADEPVCAGTQTEVVAEVPMASVDLDARDLGTLVSGVDRYFLAIIAFPDPAPVELQAASASFRFEFQAAGDSEGVGTDPPTSIAFTGVAVGGPLALAAALGVAGVVLRVAGRRRRSVS